MSRLGRALFAWVPLALLTIVVGVTAWLGASSAKGSTPSACATLGSSSSAETSGPAHLVIFMTPKSTPSERARIGRALGASSEVKRYYWMSQQAAFNELKRLFASQPDLVAGVSEIPPSYRATLVSGPNDQTSVCSALQGQPGVLKVVGTTGPTTIHTHP